MLHLNLCHILCHKANESTEVIRAQNPHQAPQEIQQRWNGNVERCYSPRPGGFSGHGGSGLGEGV